MLQRAHSILQASGKAPGVCYHPFAGDKACPVLTHLLWLDVPVEGCVPLHEASVKLDAHELASSHLAGVYRGNCAGRLGVRTWGGPPGPNLRQAIMAAWGVQIKAPATQVRVRGYAVYFRSSENSYAALRA